MSELSLNPRGGRHVPGAWVPPDAAGDLALGDSDLAVLITLCSFANKARRTYVSQARLAQETGRSVRTVRRALVRLRDRGARAYVTWTEHRKPQEGGGRLRGTNLYQIHFLHDPYQEEPMSQSDFFAEQWRKTQ